MNFEVLAPAGSMESLIAGVRSGANAIILVVNPLTPGAMPAILIMKSLKELLNIATATVSRFT